MKALCFGPLLCLGLSCLSPLLAQSELELPVVERTLDNGLKVLLLEDHSVPNIALYLGWKVGSRNERPGITGLAHFFEHMMFSSGEKFGGRFDPYMEAHGGSNNAYTSQDVTVYTDWFPASQLGRILDMEADRVRAMQLNPVLVERERGVVQAERRLDLDQPSVVMDEQLWATAFTAHSYQWGVLGWDIDIENWRQEDLREFFNLHYTPNNALLVLVGDLDPEAALQLVKEKLGEIPRGPERRPIHTQEPPQKGERRVVLEDPTASLREVKSAWHIPATAHPDFPVFELLEYLLLTGKSSVLHRLLVEGELALEVGGGCQGYQFDPSLFTVEVSLRKGVDPLQVEAVVYSALAKMRKDGPQPERLASAKRQIEARLVRGLKTIDGKAQLLLDHELFFAGWDRIVARLERTRAVTAEDVQRVLSRYFRAHNRTVVTLNLESSQEETGEEPEEDAEEPDAEEEPAKPPVTFPIEESPGLQVGLPETIDFQLDNGLRVFLLRDTEVPLINLQLRLVGGAVEDPPGKEGAAHLLAQALDQGAGERDARAFQSTVSAVGGEFSAQAGRRWLELEAEFLAADRELALELLADVLRRPRLAEEDLERLRRQAIDDVKGVRGSPDSAMEIYWKTWLFRGHPYGRPHEGDEASLARIRPADVRAAAKRQLAPSRTWLVVAGDFNPAEVRAQLEALFGDWESDSPAPQPVASPTRGEEGRVLLVDDPGAAQTYFRFGEVVFPMSDPDYPARLVANTILGGRFTSRLNTALRIERGLVYAIYSYFDDTQAGALEVSTAAESARGWEALGVARDVYGRFVQEGITARELASARNFLRGQLPTEDLETAELQAKLILDLVLDDVPRSRIDQLFQQLDGLSLKEVNRVITKRFPREPLAWVVIGEAKDLREKLAELGKVHEVKITGPGFGQ